MTTGTCVYCEKELGPEQIIFGLVLFIQNDAGFDTMVVKKFCSFSCKMKYRERIEQETKQSPRFRLGEFETKMREKP
jgi:hypothetical protein